MLSVKYSYVSYGDYYHYIMLIIASLTPPVILLILVSPTGEKLWSVDVGGPIFSSPVIYESQGERILCFGCHDNQVTSCLTKGGGG